MNEEEWLASADPEPMLGFLNIRQADERRQWLLACACCRRIWSLLHDKRSRRVIELRERHADGLASPQELRQAIDAAHHARNDARERFRCLPNFDDRSPEAAPAWAAAAASTNPRTAVRFVLNALACAAGEDRMARITREEAGICVLLRDILGNPFRPVAVQAAWLTPTVTDLAHTIYGERVFDRLPILADALEEAGCDDRQVLDHCRGPGPHVRGCFAVDLVLGRA